MSDELITDREFKYAEARLLFKLGLPIEWFHSRRNTWYRVNNIDNFHLSQVALTYRVKPHEQTTPNP